MSEMMGAGFPNYDTIRYDTRGEERWVLVKEKEKEKERRSSGIAGRQDGEDGELKGGGEGGWWGWATWCGWIEIS